MRVKCPGIALGGMSGFGIDWYINTTACFSFFFQLSPWQKFITLGFIPRNSVTMKQFVSVEQLEVPLK